VPQKRAKLFEWGRCGDILVARLGRGNLDFWWMMTAELKQKNGAEEAGYGL
jgi:hypothetical protein